MRKTPHGSALLVVVIVLLILSVLGVAMLRFGYREVVGATAASREQAMVACTQAARNLLASRLYVLGKDPMQLDPLEVDLSANLRTAAGHYGEVEVAVSQIRPLPSNAVGPSARARDISNTVAKNPESKQPYKAVIRCVHANGTELELEFGFRFGL